MIRVSDLNTFISIGRNLLQSHDILSTYQFLSAHPTYTHKLCRMLAVDTSCVQENRKKNFRHRIFRHESVLPRMRLLVAKALERVFAQCRDFHELLDSDIETAKKVRLIIEKLSDKDHPYLLYFFAVTADDTLFNAVIKATPSSLIYNRSLVHIAAESGRAETVSALLDRASNQTYKFFMGKDKLGLTPYAPSFSRGSYRCSTST